MTNEIDTLVAQYLAIYPDFVDPQAGDRHPCILAIGDQMQPWLIDSVGGAHPYWRAMASTGENRHNSLKGRTRGGGVTAHAAMFDFSVDPSRRS